jgi:hypothetical protein
MEVVIIILVVLLLAWLDGDPEPDPLELARPSVERLDAEARRAMGELRELDRDGGQ